MELDQLKDVLDITKTSEERTSSKLLWFILSTVVVVLLTVLGTWAETTSTHVDEQANRLNQVEQTEAVHSSQFEDVKEKLEVLRSGQDKMDNKIDKILEGQKHREEK